MGVVGLVKADLVHRSSDAQEQIPQYTPPPAISEPSVPICYVSSDILTGPGSRDICKIPRIFSTISSFPGAGSVSSIRRELPGVEL